jgi:integrase
MRVALRERRTESGEICYFADYYLGHRRMRRSLGSNKALAKVKLQEIQRELLLGMGTVSPEKRNITIRELAAEYLSATASRRRPRTQYEESKRFEKSILPKLGHLRLCDISQRHLEQWVSDKRAEGLQPGSVNRHIVSIKAMFRAAQEWEYIPRSPAARLKKLKEPERPARFLEQDEAERLLEATANGPPYLYPIVLLALHTGMRRSEVLHLRWQDFDFRRGEIRIENMEDHLTKSGRIRIAPMTTAVRDYFQAKRGIGFLFPSLNGKPQRQLDKSFKSALKRAGIENFRFHDLRHTFASHLTMQGVPQRSVQELLGHGSGRMTERYSHLSPSHMHDAVKKLTLGFRAEPRANGHVIGTEVSNAKSQHTGCDRN